MLAHIATLTTEVATYTNEQSNFPQLAPITRLASLSDSAALHLTALARETENPEVRAAIAAIATALTQAFEQSRTATLAAHWARTSDASHELDALIRKTESIIAMGEEILERDGSVPDDELATVAGFAFRVGKSLRVVLTERPLPARFGEATLALPLGFPAASPLGNTATISSLFQRLDHGAALSALATVVGLALSLVATAVFLPIATSPAAIGAVAVMQSTVGAVGRRGLLRFVGTFIGAIMTFVAVTIFASGAQDLGSYLIIMSVMSFISAWVMVGSPRTSYVGFMMGAAFIVGIASDSAAPSSLQLVVDRVLSVVLACACVSTVLMVFHLRSSRLAVMESIGDGWTLIAQLIRGSQLHDFTEAELQTFRTLNQRATSDLALTAELREQHAFENTLRIGTFLPMLTMLAEQQRSLLLVRSLGSGRFHETLPPSAVSELLDAPVRSLAAHFERLGGYFRDGASVDASLPFAIPSAAQLRACAVEHGCDAAMVARLLYRREVIGLMEQTAARAIQCAERVHLERPNAVLRDGSHRIWTHHRGGGRYTFAFDHMKQRIPNKLETNALRTARNAAFVCMCAISCVGCNPNLDVDGALIPAWLIAVILGLLLTIGARALLVRLGIDRHLIARPLVYVSLTVLFGCLVWLTFFRY